MTVLVFVTDVGTDTAAEVPAMTVWHLLAVIVEEVVRTVTRVAGGAAFASVMEFMHNRSAKKNLNIMASNSQKTENHSQRSKKTFYGSTGIIYGLSHITGQFTGIQHIMQQTWLSTILPPCSWYYSIY